MKIVIIDTGCANLASVFFALKRLGYLAKISRQHQDIKTADRLILPGVGSAQAAMQQLNRLELIDPLKTCNQPLLGICLGMQLLAQSSDEQGPTPTLGIIENQVTALPACAQPLPHMGWNQITLRHSHPLLQSIPDNSYFYFVHSYAMSVSPNTVASCLYGQVFSAVIQHNNYLGVQFHPERSGKIGQQLLDNFIKEVIS